jgi:hypothetical protein
MKISPGWLKENVLKNKNKNASQKIMTMALKQGGLGLNC